MKMPVVFIGHGSPMNVVSDNPFTRDMAKLGRDLPEPKAILMISAHWLSTGTFVCCDEKPEQIYDFYGFPEELYQVKYRPKGGPELARSAAKLLEKYRVRCGKWGIDHGAWSVLKHMYPKADIPVAQLSVDFSQPEKHHYEMAKALAPLREEGVLIMGSGNLVHNLSNVAWETDAQPFDWAVEFDAAAKKMLEKGDHDGLINYGKLGRIARMAVPTNDHYLPMMYPLALAGKDKITFVHESIQNGSISMRCWKA